MYIRENRPVGLQSKTTALLLGGGTSTESRSTAVADKNFMQFYTKTTATSGDSRALYVKHTLGGTTAGAGYGDCARFYTVVSGTGYAYASGIHATLSQAASATITGSGAAMRATLSAASQTRTMAGAVAALQLDSDIGANNTVPADAAFIRVTKSGSVDLVTFLDITDDQCLANAASGSALKSLKVRLQDGSLGYINIVAAS